MTYVFIADLHLSANHPRLLRGFFALLEHYHSYSHVKLYILGDWFNVWLGDDYQEPWIQEMIMALRYFTQAGHHVFVNVGNRDFALTQEFLNQFNGILLDETAYLTILDKTYRLEHGDSLCTDDVAYQRFRWLIRSPLVLGLLRCLPLTLRKRLAEGFRQKSQRDNQTKDWQIMDVNEQAVKQALRDVDVLIHGHTHRPAIHQVIVNPRQAPKQRIVLGDWREHEGQAMILEMNQLGKIQFKAWYF